MGLIFCSLIKTGKIFHELCTKLRRHNLTSSHFCTHTHTNEVQLPPIFNVYLCKFSFHYISFEREQLHSLLEMMSGFSQEFVLQCMLYWPESQSELKSISHESSMPLFYSLSSCRLFYLYETKCSRLVFLNFVVTGHFIAGSPIRDKHGAKLITLGGL